MCKHSRRKLVDRYGRIMAILAPAGARNAWEIKLFRSTTSFQIPRLTEKDMEMIEYREIPMEYCSAPTVTENVPGDGRRGVMRLLHNGKPCIVLDGELPIP